MEPRRWTNEQLRILAPIFEGRVVNVSGWKDEDRRGRHYREYFINAASYDITNYWGTGAANDGADGSIFLDLEKPLSSDLLGNFDVAFCHTVFEHIYDISTAMENLAALSQDIVILIVPSLQDEHYLEPIYGDYWRFMPGCVQKMMEDEGLEMVYCSANDNPWYPVYTLCVGSKVPQQWKDRLPPTPGLPRLGRETYNAPGFVWHT